MAQNEEIIIDIANAGSQADLPDVTNADNGRVLAVENGAWDKSVNIMEMKSVTDEVENNVIKIVPSNINMYDEEHNSIYVTSGDVPSQEETVYKRGTVYLDGYSGNIVISTAGTRAGYFADLHIYNSSGTDMGVSLGSTVNSVPNGVRQGKLVVVPEGAVYLTFRYRTESSGGGTLVSQVMVTKGDTIGTSYIPFSGRYLIEETIENDVNRCAYVALDGDDSNDGLSFENAVATFDRALSIANTIYAERGVYSQIVTISGKKGVKIYPYDNDEEFSSGVPRQMIEFNGGDKILKSAMTSNVNMYLAACSGGFQFNEVFISHTLDPITNNGMYRANVFVNLSSQGKLKLKPVLTQAGCEAEADTFYWDGTNLLCNISTSSFDSVTVHARSNSIKIENSSDVILQDVAAKYNYSSLIKIDNSIDIVLNNCEASYSATTMGFEVNNSNVKLIHCYATNNAFDGFNFHQYGYSEMIDCSSEYNFDDGCSHHNGCIGTISGGVFKGNGKGGITPAYGANVNIFNILAASNDSYGVGYLYKSGDPQMKSLISGCALVGNPIGMKVGTNWTVDAIGCKYSGNTTDKQADGTLNEY